MHGGEGGGAETSDGEGYDGGVHVRVKHTQSKDVQIPLQSFVPCTPTMVVYQPSPRGAWPTVKTW